MIKGIIFDFDGPIVKSKSWHSILSQYDEYYKLPSGTVHSITHDYFAISNKGDCQDVAEYF